jgi:hypothetical protein
MSLLSVSVRGSAIRNSEIKVDTNFWPFFQPGGKKDVYFLSTITATKYSKELVVSTPISPSISLEMPAEGRGRVV